jgi:hypothetical protein
MVDGDQAAACAGASAAAHGSFPGPRTIIRHMLGMGYRPSIGAAREVIDLLANGGSERAWLPRG